MGLGSIAGALGSAGLQTGLQIWGENRALRQNKQLANQQWMRNMAMAAQQNQWNTDIWDRQKAHNLQMFDLQNRYNSPQAQMARFKAAGLNPQLMYGKGSSGNASPVAPANLASAADVKGYTRATAKNVLQGHNTFSNMYQFKNLQAQTNNAEAQQQVIKQTAANLATDGLAKVLDLKIKTKSEKSLVELAKYNAEVAASNAANIGASTERTKLLTPLEERVARETISKIKKETQGVNMENKIKKAKLAVANLDARLARKGVRPNDSIKLRILEAVGLGFIFSKEPIPHDMSKYKRIVKP